MRTMPKMSSSPFSFPEFKGATRTLVFVNLATFFALLLAQVDVCGAGGEPLCAAEL